MLQTWNPCFALNNQDDICDVYQAILRAVKYALIEEHTFFVIPDKICHLHSF